MKKSILLLGALALLGFTACEKGNDVPRTEKHTHLYNITVIASQSESVCTKAAFGEISNGKIKTSWQAGDHIDFQVNFTDYSNGVTVAENGESVTFNQELNITENAEGYTFYSVYPSAQYSNDQQSAFVTIPPVQEAAATFPANMFLAANSEKFAEVPTIVELNYRHIAAYANVIIRNPTLDEGDSMSSLTITSSQDLSGTYGYEFTENNIFPSPGETMKTLALNNLSSDGNWFACAPQAAGTEWTVSVKTAKGKSYSRTITLENGLAGAAKIGINFKDVQADASDAKVAYILPDGPQDDDEAASQTWFSATFTNGAVISSADMNADYDLSKYKVVWVHIDRVGITAGINNLPISSDAISALATYCKNGGNVLLCNHAVQLAVPVCRESLYENYRLECGSGDGGDNRDVWTINTHIGFNINGDKYDRTSHAIYSGLTTFNNQFALIGAGYKEDHNCFLDYNTTKGTGNEETLTDFENGNSATVLATWAHVMDYCNAGIVEYHPTETVRGSCITIGLAAYEWNQNSGTNAYQSNIELMTKNAINYLATK